MHPVDKYRMLNLLIENDATYGDGVNHMGAVFLTWRKSGAHIETGNKEEEKIEQINK